MNGESARYTPIKTPSTEIPFPKYADSTIYIIDLLEYISKSAIIEEIRYDLNQNITIIYNFQGHINILIIFYDPLYDLNHEQLLNDDISEVI